MAGAVPPRGIAVFVSGHTHAPAISTLTRPDGTQTVIVNTGCWLRQLQPVEAWLGVPPVWVPAFVLSHVRVRSGQDGVMVELWEHPKPAERRLPWIERVAIAGKMPPQPPGTLSLGLWPGRWPGAGQRLGRGVLDDLGGQRGLRR
jgi:hypothetical protein